MRKLLSTVMACMVLCACNKVPSEIIQPDEMALLMADVHTSESVIELNWDQFRSDSAKQVLKESVYAAHGVSAEQVDSSLAWYGRNITYYMDVYDNTIAILEKRLIERGNKVAAAAAMSIAGDSVNVWDRSELHADLRPAPIEECALRLRARPQLGARRHIYMACQISQSFRWNDMADGCRV